MESNFINENGYSSNVSLLSLLMAEDDPPQDQNHYSFNRDNNILSSISEPSSFINPPLTNTTNLPDLLSLENYTNPPPSLSPPQPKISDSHYTLDSIVENYFNNSKKKSKKPAQRRPRKTIGEQAYCLGKVIPGCHNRRRSTAETLEEAHKYIKFLQAQVDALKSMPVEASMQIEVGGQEEGQLFGSLNRQQVLKVVVNSSVAQTVMTDNGWCLLAAEQVALLQRIEARKRLIHQLLANIPI